MYLSCQQQQQLLNLMRSDFTHNVFVDAHKRTQNLFATIQLSFLKVLTDVVFVNGEAKIDRENWRALWPDNIYWEKCGITAAAVLRKVIRRERNYIIGLELAAILYQLRRSSWTEL